jgi:adenylosuccinate synthase
MSIGYADVIVDLQAGDTGKGKVAHAIAETYHAVLRYNGGANAGHTVYHNGKKVVTHQVPVGIFYDIPSIIGPGCVVNLPKLYDEVNMLRDMGFKGTVYVDRRVHVTTEEHLKEDTSDTKIGTTRQGIGPTYRDKYARIGKRIGEVIKYNRSDLPYEVIDLYQFLHGTQRDINILCEGAQGFQIDIDWGDYPYVTSSHCTVGAACLNGIPPHKIRRIYGIMKAYETYSGFKTFNTDNEDQEILNKIQELGGEFGATTGRKRQVRWLDMDGVLQAMNINGVTDLIINKIDILDMVEQYGLIYKGNKVIFTNGVEFRHVVENIIDNGTHTRVNSIRWSVSPNGI